jgi:hypothetical protein
MQRLSRLPATPWVVPLLRRKSIPSSLSHQHHLQKNDFYQVVLHRPVEPARDFGNSPAPGSSWSRNLSKT